MKCAGQRNDEGLFHGIRTRGNRQDGVRPGSGVRCRVVYQGHRASGSDGKAPKSRFVRMDGSAESGMRKELR